MTDSFSPTIEAHRQSRMRNVVASGLIAISVSVVLFVTGVWIFGRWQLAAAEAAVDEGRWTVAEKKLTRLLARSADNATAHALMARVGRETGKWPAVLTHAPLVPDDHPRAAFTKLCLAEAQLQSERGADVESTLRECLMIDPGNIEARRGLVHLFRWHDRITEARDLLNELFELTPASERAAVLGERFLVDFGQFTHDVAKHRLTRWLQATPTEPNTLAALARLHAADGEYAESIDLAGKALRIRPENVEARRTLVLGLVRTGQAVGAGTALREWPEGLRDARYWESRGIWLQDGESNFTEAADCFRRLLRENPDDWQIRHRLSTCLRVAGKADEAAEQSQWADRIRDLLEYTAIQKLLQESLPRAAAPDQAIRFGELYESIGRNDVARAWYELVLDRDRESSAARAALARLRDSGTGA